MFRNDDVLRQTIDSVQASMRECRIKMKNRALLSNISDFSPILPSETRRSGKYEMIDRFNNIYSELLDVSQSGMEFHKSIRELASSGTSYGLTNS